ncbi:MAG TPA: zf-HC2 domain-containing protein, partial [Methylomirabilota bacterium]|nr:zf-HC2 domain-containing protein [Methylomirabilota bacterium]
MRCQDVRQALPLLVEGEMPLTEWAFLEMHLAKCSECRSELERRRDQAAARTRARRRKWTAVALGATAVVLVVAGAGYYIYEASLPDAYRPGFMRSPLRPPSPPMTVTPVSPPAAAPSPVAPPVTRPTPVAAPP